MAINKIKKIFQKYTMANEEDTKLILFPEGWKLTDEVKEVYLLIYNQKAGTATYELLDLEKQMYYYMMEIGPYVEHFFELSDIRKLNALLNFFDEEPVINCKDMQNELKKDKPKKAYCVYKEELLKDGLHDVIAVYDEKEFKERYDYIIHTQGIDWADITSWTDYINNPEIVVRNTELMDKIKMITGEEDS